ncbi:hypothetical protein AB0A74_41985 [Saccharothrix sp. NPDC042600]
MADVLSEAPGPRPPAATRPATWTLLTADGRRAFRERLAVGEAVHAH